MTIFHILNSEEAVKESWPSLSAFKEFLVKDLNLKEQQDKELVLKQECK